MMDDREPEAHGLNFEMERQEREELSKFLDEASDLKERGNSLYKSRDYDAAEAFYARGFDIIMRHVLPLVRKFKVDSNGSSSSHVHSKESLEDMWERIQRIFVSLLSNIILTKITLKQPQEAENLASSYLDQVEFASDPQIQMLRTYCRTYPKLWYRRAQSREALKSFREAEADYSICLSLLEKRTMNVNTHPNNDASQLSREIREVTLAWKKVRQEINHVSLHGSSPMMATPLKSSHPDPIKASVSQLHSPLDPRVMHKHLESSIKKPSCHHPDHQRPSPDTQRSIVLQLLAQSHNVHQYSYCRPQDATVRKTEEVMDSIPGHHSERRIRQPGEAYFVIHFDWWKRWCAHVNFFFEREYSAVLKILDDAKSIGAPVSKITLRKALEEKEYLDQKRIEILHLLPPGSSLVSSVHQDGTMKKTKRRTNSDSSESSSLVSSDSSSCENEYNSDGYEIPCIDNSSLILYFKDLQMSVANSDGDRADFKYSTGSSSELLLWDWRHKHIMTTICNRDFHGDSDSLFPLLRPHLVRGYHYEILDREVYAALSSWYGEISPRICRRLVENKESKDMGLSLLLYPEFQGDPTYFQTQYHHEHYCAACGSTRALFRCRNCRNVYYCDEQCKESHWNYHKKKCNIYANQTPRGLSSNEFVTSGNRNSLDDHLSSFNSVERGPRPARVGLNNLGNTCFMNAAVQCLSHTTPLTRHFLSDRFKLDLNLRNPLGTGGKLTYAYENVIKELWMSQKPSISPAKLKRAISLFAPQFAGSAQHDSQEFLAFLLDGLHEDLNLVKNPPYVVTPDFTMDKDLCVAGAEAWDAYCRRNNSLVMDSFYGQFKSTCVCPRCNSVSVSYDAFNHVSLEIPEVTTGPQVELVLIRSRTADTAETSPTRYWFQVPRNACWSDLKDSLSRVSGVPVTKLSVCDVYDNEIYEIFDDQKSVSNVQSSDTVVAYEIDPYTHSTIHAIASHMQSPIDKSQVENSKRSFGYPLLLSFNVGLTCGEVWHYIWNQISYVFVDTLDPNVSSQMRIRIVHKDGLPREVFPVAIGVTDSNDIKNVSSTLPRYSNIPLSTYLGSQCTERFLFLHLEWTIESEDEILTQKRFLRTEEHSSVAESMRRKNDRVTLERCFEKFARSERLDQYNLWYCSFCKEHVRAMKTIELWRVPNILIVHFKRFEYFHAFRREKIETLVHFPLESLDMNKFCGPFKANDSFVDNKIPALYDLFGVINHVGRMGFGHYYATCRHFTDTHIEKDWFSFDDSSVEFIETPETNIISSSAYVLFYRRRIFS